MRPGKKMQLALSVESQFLGEDRKHWSPLLLRHCLLCTNDPHAPQTDMLISLHSTPRYKAGNIMEHTLSMRSLRPRKLESEAFTWGQGLHGHILCSFGLCTSASTGKLSTCAQRSQDQNFQTILYSTEGTQAIPGDSGPSVCT